MKSSEPPEPLEMPAGARIVDASGRGLAIYTPAALVPGRLVEFEVMLGNRPLPVIARVTASLMCGMDYHRVELEFVGLAQADGDDLTSVLPAAGLQGLRIRPRPGA